MLTFKYLSDYAVGRDNNFNLIRFIAATLVLFTHSYALTGAIHDPLIVVTGIDFGTLAVDIFFITSGFLVTGSLIKRADIKAFVRARLLRILPGLLVANLFAVLIIGAVYTTLPLLKYLGKKTLYKFIFANTTLVTTNLRWTLPGVFEDNPFKGAINGSLWTLPYEMKLYGVLLLAGLLTYTSWRLLSPRRLGYLLIGAALLLVGYNLYNYISSHEVIAGWRLAGMFISGSAIYFLKQRIIMSGWLAAVMMALLVVYAEPLLDQTFYVFYWLFLAYLTFWLAYVPGGPLRQFNKLGDYSYGIYIYAFPIQQAIVASWPDIGAQQLFFSAFPPTLLAAVLSWHYVEKRALAMKLRR